MTLDTRRILVAWDLSRTSKGVPSHQTMLDAYHLNSRMDHRGGCGFEANTGDGAGILMALPHSFFKKVAKDELNEDLPEAGRYSVGNIFLPRDQVEREQCVKAINQIILEEGQRLLGWRDVPTDSKGADVGSAALLAKPHITQLFIAAAEDVSGDAFERVLYLIRKAVHTRAAQRRDTQRGQTGLCLQFVHQSHCL